MKKTLTALKRSPHASTDMLIALAIALLFTLAAFLRLGVPHQLTDAEAAFTHGMNPPLGKLLFALLHALLGSGMLAARLPSVVFGAFGILLTYALAKRISGDRLISTVATLLLAVDGAYFVQSRLATPQTFETVFVLLAAYGAWQFRKAGKKHGLWLLGIGLGCALATSQTGLVAWLVLAVYVFPHTLQKGQRKTLLPLLVCFFLAPILVYLVAIIAQAGLGLSHPLQTLLSLEWHREFWPRTLALQVKTWSSYPREILGMPFGTWQRFASNTQGSLALLGWVGIPALLTVTMRTPFLTWIGLGMWLAWGINPQLAYLLPVLPFVCISIALLLSEIGKRKHLKWLARAVPVLAVGWFVACYPALSGGHSAKAPQWLNRNLPHQVQPLPAEFPK